MGDPGWRCATYRYGQQRERVRLLLHLPTQRQQGGGQACTPWRMDALQVADRLRLVSKHPATGSQGSRSVAMPCALGRASSVTVRMGVTCICHELTASWFCWVAGGTSLRLQVVCATSLTPACLTGRKHERRARTRHACETQKWTSKMRAPNKRVARCSIAMHDRLTEAQTLIAVTRTHSRLRD